MSSGSIYTTLILLIMWHYLLIFYTSKSVRYYGLKQMFLEIFKLTINTCTNLIKWWKKFEIKEVMKYF